MEQIRNVTVIPARKKAGRKNSEIEAPKTRVAAYCRVSTDYEEQATSYEAQVDHYTEYIKSKPEWEFAGIYADEGISGTDTKKRSDFNRMINDCMDGKIDMVITKSISRFARNTLDCLQYIRKLKNKGIPVFFEKENINTMDAKGEFLITIMASLAQQESQSMSQNIRMGYQFRFQEGKVVVNHNNFLGYTKNEDGQLVIVPEEAVVVKRIFREFLEGSSLRDICRSLESDGILTGGHKPIWRPETVRQMLQNEKYMGDALLQKTYTVDYLSKKKAVNKGQVPQYYVENSHEAIIPKEIFIQAQEELARRSSLYTPGNKKRLYSSKYALSNIAVCGTCGENYRRIKWDNHGCKSIVWRCISRVEKGRQSECKARTIREGVLQDAVMAAINNIFNLSDDFYERFQLSIEAALIKVDETGYKRIDDRLANLQKKVTAISENDPEYEKVVAEIYELRDQRRHILHEEATRAGKRKSLNEMMEFVRSQPEEIKVYDENLVRRFIEQVTIFDDYITVRFKSGIEVNVQA